MTQGQCVKAYLALSGIAEKEWPFREAWDIAQLRKRLRDAWDFQAEQEAALLNRYGGRAQGGGTAVFADAAAKQAFEADLRALNGMDAGPDADPIRLTPPKDMSVSPDALAALEGFVVFGEE